MQGYVGQMLQKLGHFDRSNVFFARAVETTEKILGRTHALTADAYETLVMAYFKAGDHRRALAAQKIVCSYMSEAFGDAHERTQEAALILANLAERAVVDAKKEKEEEEAALPKKRTKKVKAPRTRTASTSAPVSSAAPAARTPPTGPKPIGSRPLDEVLRFLGEPVVIKKGADPAPLKKKVRATAA
ncbi:hypothetical protein BDK51DRAFT_36476 [Blyttiomyces helicus]|uniref:Tetratricopeptide repeat protein n=1 Tax=Blyttiomyces helicus TaxID=388810 RepID=A0A4P9W1H4_9FUNG|nr:hypothetical protein BDK51DRAFT_36476 [Blyttiomyces helicus]|eukprot:RKO84578.1 hypothetical protein BDK51DRAFT_36476 [Blyttiomyces helicus]